MTIKPGPSRAAPLWCFAALFVVAVPFNYLWERAQGLLFVGMDGGSASTWLHCFIASLGDGVLIWIIFVVGWIIFKRSDWFFYPGDLHYSVMLAAGLGLGVVVEWVGVRLINRWTYTDQMPLIPGLAIGLVPVIQMVVLPPAIFVVAAVWLKHGSVNSK
ncbi:MAG: hypothetical protein EPN64_18175 [Burkholderiaceae bacterium]|nr:MAG: hypothetical protein EPN64_18175 [Burkholderiaceae bacterium]